MNLVTVKKNRLQFEDEIYRRLNNYFSENNLSQKGEKKMWLKVTFGFAWWVISYFLIYAFAKTDLQFLLFYIVHGTAHLFILLNIAHDANHHAISKKLWINKILSYSFDICGLNSYMWRILHHQNHHYTINIHGEDETLFAGGCFRFSSLTPPKKIFKYQHIYVFLLYGFLTLDWMFVKDIKYFFSINNNVVKGVKHHFNEYLSLIITKAFFYTYMIVLPMVILGFSFWIVLMSFLITEFLIGVTASFILQIVHPLDDAEFPSKCEQYDHFVYHVLATTSDYSASNPLANWLLGGLNLHVVHHFTPHVCHTHFPALTKIVKYTAEEYDVKYRENNTMRDAIVKHCVLLKRMGNPELTISEVI